ncbi:MalY/PatB family protein [Sulfurisoma sediminicola]|uniref:cysteine-S-conjugate beta-lyase n=1 Tax=Sulfurisoma sediminicola TaxID=1381557 RepID=A0A497XL70_9PROT|nr:PatB family C-S lyase [Sulfurisoma sediminicola]RLJ68157.1 cystathionine beta-lyase [Sulfurisoma sediminicola]
MSDFAATFDFDRVIDRRGSDSLKWNKYSGRDILPLWVADMDFAAPPAVLEALRRRVGHGVFGYGQPWPSLLEAVQEHCRREYGWDIEQDWIVWLPGLVTGLHVACRATGQASDGVFTATPVYPPFLSAPSQSQRRLAGAEFLLQDGRWRWDFDAVAAALARERPKLWLLCHPHNPLGRAWHEDELREILRLAEKHDVVVCSDEIHCDLMLEPRRHMPFARLGAAAARRSITLMAPSKTFNVPGLGCAFALIPDARLRRDFRSAMHGIVPHVNTLGLVACEAAYREGGDWRAACIAYLRDNARRVEEAVGALPGLAMAPVEATYLAWIDARGLGVPDPQRFFEQAGVGLSDGADFGPGGKGFVRLNFGCPRATLDTALERMAKAVLRL